MSSAERAPREAKPAGGVDLERRTTSQHLSHPVYLVCAVSVIVLAVSSDAQTTTYTYTGNAYDFLTFSTPTVCPLTGSFTTTQPIPPDSPLIVFTPTSFSFTDCATTITNLNASYSAFFVTTDSNGKIATWGIRLDAPVNVVVAQSVDCPGGVCTASSIDILSGWSINAFQYQGEDHVQYFYNDIFGDGFY